MYSTVACPDCSHKLMLPEGDMGKPQVCPKCQAQFFAGKSVAEPSAGRPPSSAPQPSYARTMLGETAPPIKYHCPRCQAPLEAPASEAGTKKPCPKCSQRLQVPAASRPEPAAVQPGLNKTILA